MRPKSSKPPTYLRLKRPNGRDLAFVILAGRRIYLGQYGSPESIEKYKRAIAEFSAGQGEVGTAPPDITVVEVLNRFREYAESYYRTPNGGVGKELENYLPALTIVQELCGRMPARDFTPRELKAVRQVMIERGWSRRHINRQVVRVRTVFKWAVSEGLVPAALHTALTTVDGLRAGRSDAAESEPVRPVTEQDMRAILPHVSPVVADMIQLQWHTGMRPGEVCIMRRVDIDTTGNVWHYRPSQHKCSFRGRDRQMSPAAETIWLDRLEHLPPQTVVKLWAEYARIRDESLRADGDGHEATEFYAAHRADMDAGAVVAWPARYLASRGEISAVQHAMNLKLDNERAFFAEYQNEPLRPSELRADVLTVPMVCEKANGRQRREVPLACTKLTMFLDVHNKLLYYCVCAWQEDFTGYVIDYGTFPEQSERSFALDGARRTLGRTFPGVGPDGAIQAGLERLVSTYLATDFRREAGLMRIDRLLVDMGYKPGLVAAAKHKVGGSTMMLYKGLGIRAGSKPMSSYARRPGETMGHYWYVPNVNRTAEFPHVAADVNYWKTFTHTALSIAAGDAGALTIFGQARDHELFAQHIAASETWTVTQGHGRTVHEWTLLPSKPDNHWLDCLTGCAVAASTLGIGRAGEANSGRQRKRYTQADLQRK